MDRDFVRLELLKLTYRATGALAAGDAVMHARQLENYVFEPGAEKPAVEVKPPEPPPKESPAVGAKASAKNKKGDNSIFG